jgi:succinate-acetate transporter protein
MERMFRVLAFWTGIFTVMFFIGDMYKTSLLFLVQTAFFLTLSYLKLSERMYMYLFAAYLTVFMVGFTWYSEFILVPGFGH